MAHRGKLLYLLPLLLTAIARKATQVEKSLYNLSSNSLLRSQILRDVKKGAVQLGLSASLLVGAVYDPRAAYALNEQQQVVAEVWRTVDKLYFDREFNGVNWFDLRQQAIKAAAVPLSPNEFNELIANMLVELGDKYTRYLPTAKYQTLVQSATGESAGIGISIGIEGDYPTIIGVEEGTPAEKAGLRPGDILIQSGGEDLYRYTPDDAAALLRGPEGSKVAVKVDRIEGDAHKMLEVILNREKFKIRGVSHHVATIGGMKVGIIKIKSFSASTAADVAKSIAELRKAASIQALILDLRGNAGGLLTGSVDTARIFLPANKDIVFVNGKAGLISSQNTGAEEGSEVTVPLFLLVDGQTASASEVLSAALQENGRAELIGSNTFGKGVIQTVEPLSGGAGVAVTVARYETPKRHDINGRGISVDIEASCLPKQQPEECVPPSAIGAR